MLQSWIARLPKWMCPRSAGRRAWAGWLLIVVVVGGCGPADPEPAADAPAQDSLAENPAPAMLDSPGDPRETELVPADMNSVGVKGREYGGGLVTEPVSQYWRQQDRLMLQQIEYALKLYRAEHGNFPASQQEFLDLVAEQGLKLPQLQPGHEYVYEAETGQLFVRRPR